MRVLASLAFFLLLAPPAGAGPICGPGGLELTVDDAAPLQDVLPGGGVCLTASGSCTLYAALVEANAYAGCDRIHLPAGLYLVLPGQLEIRDDLELIGAGADQVVIDAQYGQIDPNCIPVTALPPPGTDPPICPPQDSLLGFGPSPTIDVDASVRALIQGVTIQRGVSGWGGGIRNAGPLIVAENVIQR
ncbi:MAG: hypothetical protein ACE5FG_04025 [Myxococcota bacterium]